VTATDPRDIRIIETTPSGDVIDAATLMEDANVVNVFDAVDEEEEDRGGWGNKLDFLFSCISVSVGLGSKFFPLYSCGLLITLRQMIVS